ncbi:hypothetical protein CHU92_10730 [Flavobacterium cyanobacteriorum]|uniref:Carboxypeptidase-like regulatory domain-containing protein n=1 Tax=Flavobacterium cyanobacteriorum TaxID=2022802 RepID=A0A255Z4V9_9FLAO|nr:DUF5686 family protein [Flavobacterium cyanobacteriorum]OYQ35680.1 hypothetical protein CHU92_10730 [Flavobacterium cyanobacteriorum]
MKSFICALFFVSLSLNAQTGLTIVVESADKGEALPFATVTVPGGEVFITDIDGRINLQAQHGHVTVSYTGYKTQKADTGNRKSIIVRLEPRIEQLARLVIDRDNPANAIIREAIKRKNTNDPLKKLNTFRYTTYEKLTVTANPDSISEKLDSVYVYEKAGRRFKKIDSTDFKFKRLVEKRHLYQTEKISGFSFNRAQGLKENILAIRMAGFKEPLYEVISLKLQPYSIYGDIELAESRCRGPLTENAPYRFRVLDTVAILGRDTYAVFFTPKRKSKKFRLEGILYIDVQTYGVAKALLRVKNALDITANQEFIFNTQEKLWFPERHFLKVTKGNSKRDIRILGETITFDASDEEARTRKKEPSDFVYLVSEGYSYDIEFNIPLTIRRPSVEVEVSRDASSRDEHYWNRYRKDTLDARSTVTYPALDSIVKKENYEKLIFLGRRVLNGYFPAGFVDIDLRHLIRYNVHEGFRPGIGGITNSKFSEIFRISAYGGYGTRDGRFKYSLGAAIRIGKFSNTWIGGSYTDDLMEIGSIRFETDKKIFRIIDNRPLNISTFYNYQTWQTYIESRKIAKTEARLQLDRTWVEPRFDYAFVPGNTPYRIFNITMATASIQWNPFSQFMQTPNGRIETEKRFPKFAFQYSQSIEGLLKSNFTFSKLDFRTEYEKKYLNGHKTTLLMQTGIAIGETPLTHLYSLMPNSRDRETILARLRFAGKNSFETMYFNEFFSSRYMILQARHGLPKYNLFGKINLAPVLVTRFAWGDMDDSEKHTGVIFNTLEKGYYESGFELNEIYKVIGLSGFYRYGPYHLPKFNKNIAVKVSVTINLF